MNLYTIHDHSLIAWYFLPICTKMSNWRALSFFFLPRNMCVCHSVYRSSQTFMSQRFCRSIQRAIVICLDYRPVPILLLQCWKVAHWNAIKFPKNTQKSKKWLPKFQNLLPKSLDIFLWTLVQSFIFVIHNNCGNRSRKIGWNLELLANMGNIYGYFSLTEQNAWFNSYWTSFQPIIR